MGDDVDRIDHGWPETEWRQTVTAIFTASSNITILSIPLSLSECFNGGQRLHLYSGDWCQQVRAIEELIGQRLIFNNLSGLGFAICCRLIDDFLETRDDQQSLKIIFTTRHIRKSNDTQALLTEHLHRAAQLNATSAHRVSFQTGQVDLTSLRSVQNASQQLLQSIPRLDAIILNAGMAVSTGINWPQALWDTITDPLQALTYPRFILSSSGTLTKPQLLSQTTASPEPLLGQVFCTNVFGHYFLTHYLTPLLSNHSPSSPHRGRVIWVSSLEAYAWTFSRSDFQALRSRHSYESSKRLTDILAITGSLPSTKPWVDRFLTPPPPQPRPKSPRVDDSTSQPRLYLAHPGICATDIVPVHFIMGWFKMVGLYLVRWLGSPWHTIEPYKAACVFAWLALAAQTTLDVREERGGKAKWGSGTDRRGQERVLRTEIEGWGFGGKTGEEEKYRVGRKSGAVDLADEMRVEFEQLGRDVWREMETLRVEWEERLK